MIASMAKTSVDWGEPTMHNGGRPPGEAMDGSNNTLCKGSTTLDPGLGVVAEDHAVNCLQLRLGCRRKERDTPSMGPNASQRLPVHETLGSRASFLSAVILPTETWPSHPKSEAPWG